MTRHAKRVFLECTPTYSTDMTTGIQRVVRNLVHYACTASNDEQLEMIPVIFQGNKLFSIPSDSFSKKPASQTENNNKGIVSFMLGLNKNTFIIFIKDKLRGRLYPLLGFSKQIFSGLMVRLKTRSDNLPEVQPEQQDILVLIDMFWGRKHWEKIAKLRAEGVIIIFVIYDLIPVNFKHFYGEQIAHEFDEFLKQMLQHADRILCISKSVQNDLEFYINRQNKNLAAATVTETTKSNIDFFHLGADNKELDVSKPIRPSLENLFSASQSPVFLIVSTIEPRKNHCFLLDAFEQLWEKNITSRLLIVGRIGQLAESIIKRIDNHVDLNKHLFVFHDLNDAEVSFCYQHSTALVFPSFAEGFGLPIIEALQNGLTVIASDIPVHREIAQNKIMYLDPHNPATLVQLVQQISIEGVQEQFIPEHFKWMNWQQATEQFLNKVLEVKA